MPSLLVTVFLLQLAIHLVNTIGASTINRLLWNLYNLLPTQSSKTTAEQKRLKSQFIKLRKELHATSSQDEFAKWAKLRRQHDKILEQLEKSSMMSQNIGLKAKGRMLTAPPAEASADTTKATFESAVSTLRWLGTNGLRMFLQFWYQKQPMFWIPKGWFPYYAEWLLSFPRAPVGSISIHAWSLSCAAIILLVSDALVAIISLVMGLSFRSAQKGKGQPMKVPTEKAGPEEPKKEL